MNFASVYSDTCWPFHSSIKQNSKRRPIQAPVEKGERVNTSYSAVNGEASVSSGLFSSIAT